MKIIKYKFLSCAVNHGTEENPVMEKIFLDKKFECKTKAEYDANLIIAEKEAEPGTLDPDNEGEFDYEPGSESTADDILNALLGVTE